MHDSIYVMSDQIIIKEKLTRWFWCWGVLTLSLLYIACLFASLSIWFSISDDTIFERELTQIESRVRSFYAFLDFIFLGISLFMIVWSIVVAIKVFKISSQTKLNTKSLLLMRISVIICPIIAMISFMFLAGLFRVSYVGQKYTYLFHKFITFMAS